MIKKFELLTNDFVEPLDCYSGNMHRIRALVDIPAHGVRAGDLGGFLWDEGNLSHEGQAWVGGNARVAGNVSGDALVSGQAWVGPWVLVLERAQIRDWAILEAIGWVGGDARVGDHAILTDVIVVRDRAHVGGRVRLSGGDAGRATVVGGEAHLTGDLHLNGSLQLIGTGTALAAA
ncbi:hypothetical protein ACFO0J_02255 [Castellaniella hirudinis]|uniref:Polymer-forming cytoskeletal protein n=1 Tax=Castellaniella hirudinis TaxID=1144617 RepID=A0ABV8RUJ6_9BURK